MNPKKTTFLLTIFLTLMISQSYTIPRAFAITIDGTVTDSEWIYWFTDVTFTSSSHYKNDLNFTAYWYTDSSNLYIAVNTTEIIHHLEAASVNSSTEIDDSKLYEAVNKSDIIIGGIGDTGAHDVDTAQNLDTEYIPWDQMYVLIDVPPYGIGPEDVGFGIITTFHPYHQLKYFLTGMADGGWSSPKPLPSGSNIVAGQTDSYRSYELCIPVSLLGIRPGDVVNVAFSLYDLRSSQSWAYNNHPDRLCWTDPSNWEPTPPLPIPEVPLGTILLLATSFAAYFILKRYHIT